MSVIRCDCCENFIDTDYSDDGCWEIAGKDYVCGTCFHDPERDWISEDTGELKDEYRGKP